LSVEEALNILDGTTAGDEADARKTIEKYIKKQKSEFLSLEKQVTKQKEKQSELSRTIEDSMKDTTNALVYAAGEQKKLLADAVSWVTNTKEQYLYSQLVAEQYKELGRDIGLSATQSKFLADSFKQSLPYFAKMGLDASDLRQTISEIMEESGRFKGFFPPEDTKRMADMIVGLGLSNQEVGSLVDRFDLMGVSVGRMYDSLSEVYGDAQSLGLNAKKVTDVLQRNFASMQRMSFKGGVKAMTEMAKLAVDMRMDVADMLGMADKFYNPEAAIEAAAELQLMGGDIAKAFGDPFEVMYMARNKPEELAKKLEEMTQNMTVFNEETGEYTLPAEARQQLTFMADKLGLSKDNVIDMAYQTSKLKDIREAFDGSNMFSEGEQSAIASMAKFKEGKWVVDFEGKSIPIENTSDIENAIKGGMLETQPDEDPILQTAKSTFTTADIAKQSLEQLKAQTQLQVDFYSTLEKGMVKPQESLTKLLNDLVTNTGEILKDSDKVGEDMSEIMTNPEKFAEKFGEKIATQLETMNDFVNDIMVGDADLIDILKSKLDLLNNNMTSFMTKTSIVEEIPVPDGIMGPGDNLIKKPKGSMSAIIRPDVNDYAFFIQKDKVTKGGDKTTTTNNNTNQTTNQNVNFNATIKLESNNPSLDLSGMEDRISKTISNMFLNGKGSIDGNNTSKSNRTMVGGGSL
jgi:hypothetical protein